MAPPGDSSRTARAPSGLLGLHGAGASCRRPVPGPAPRARAGGPWPGSLAALRAGSSPSLGPALRATPRPLAAPPCPGRRPVATPCALCPAPGPAPPRPGRRPLAGPLGGAPSGLLALHGADASCPRHAPWPAPLAVPPRPGRHPVAGTPWRCRMPCALWPRRARWRRPRVSPRRRPGARPQASDFRFFPNDHQFDLGRGHSRGRRSRRQSLPGRTVSVARGAPVGTAIRHPAALNPRLKGSPQPLRCSTPSSSLPDVIVMRNRQEQDPTEVAGRGREPASHFTLPLREGRPEGRSVPVHDVTMGAHFG